MRGHHPPHLYLDNTWYLLTAATNDRSPILTETGAKETIRDALHDLANAFRISLGAWVILDNHYHLLLRSNDGSDIPSFVHRLHGRTARDMNLARGITHRKIWHNYWDTGIRNNTDLWTKFNYIHQNPVKHGYVDRIEAWPFSSYHFYARTKGSDWLADCFGTYPVVEFATGEDF